tara:strand:+ start:263 stop:583 length:321 start_codon:yes stop_codon:yes gene_type:complete
MTRKLDDMAQILSWKHNDQQGMTTDGGVIIEFPGGIPSDEDIDTWKKEYDAHVVATAYVQKRVDAYAEFGEQLDQLYHDMAADKGDKTGEWFKAVKKVKDDNPKEP